MVASSPSRRKGELYAAVEQAIFNGLPSGSGKVYQPQTNNAYTDCSAILSLFIFILPQKIRIP